jgi:signal transduction histidine kinase
MVSPWQDDHFMTFGTVSANHLTWYTDCMPCADLQGTGASSKVSPDHHGILHWAAYLTVAGVAAAELLALPLGPRFTWTAALLAAFAVVLVLVFRAKHGPGMPGILVPSLTASAIVVGIMAAGAAPSLGAILFFPLCAIIGMQFSMPVTVTWIIGASAALLACLLVFRERNWIPILLGYAVGFFAFGAFAVAFRHSLQARAESQQLLAELSSAQGRLRDLAVLEERQRLAREMHDAVGHRLTAAAVLLEGAARLIPSEPARATRMVETSRTQVRQGLDELRAAVSALHADTHSSPLCDVLAALVEVFAQGAEAKVGLEVQPGMAEPDPDRKLVIIRTAQEALTNVQKHAAATRVNLVLKVQESAYVLTCRDNGRGIAAGENPSAGTKGFGLGNLRMRAAAFGGSVDLDAVPDGGAELRLTLPAAAGAVHA